MPSQPLSPVLPRRAAPVRPAFELPVPDNLVEFIEMYGTDDACREALFGARWPRGFTCPVCSHDKGWKLPGYAVIECQSCGYQASATAGTLLHGTKLPLSKLFLLLYLIVAEKDGANCCQIERQLGVNYKTARLWTLKFREMLLSRDKNKLGGSVEADETIVGGSDGTSMGRRLGENRNYVLILVEDKGPRCGWLRLEAIDNAGADMLATAVACNVKPGATVHTDGLAAYEALKDSAVRHKVTVIGDPKQASRKFPKVHLIASLLKRYVLGTLQGSQSRGWLPWLLAEFEFRFNRRNSNRRPGLFARMLEFGQDAIGQTRRYFEALGKQYREQGLA